MKLRAYIAALHAALFAILLAVQPAGSGSMALLGAGKASGGATTTTWDPSNKGTAVTLSGTNGVTATVGAIGSNAQGVATIASHSTGKYYVELTIGSVSSIVPAIGIANSALSTSGPTFLGNDNNGVSYLPLSGNVQVNAAPVSPCSPCASFTTGDVVSIAFDAGAKLIWFRVNGGTWNTAGNPALGTGGVDLGAAGVAAGPYFLVMFGFSGFTPGAVTGNFDVATATQSVPSGFGNW